MNYSRLYSDIVNTIINAMNDNKIKSISMKGSAIGKKLGWMSLNTGKLSTDSNDLFFTYKSAKDKKVHKISLQKDLPNGRLVGISPFDLVSLLSYVVDSITNKK